MNNRNKDFEKAYENIKAPTELKKETLSRMFQEDEQMKQEKRMSPDASNTASKGAKPRIYRYGALALAACAAVLCFVLMRPQGAVYKTPVEDGSYYEEIELKDGRIKFVQNRVAISITPNAGQVVVGSEEDNNSEGAQTVIAKKETQAGGELIYRENAGISLPEIREDAWSNIGTCDIYVTALKTDVTRYQAVFEKDGTAFEVIGTGVTQKEFIDFLYAQVK